MCCVHVSLPTYCLLFIYFYAVRLLKISKFPFSCISPTKLDFFSHYPLRAKQQSSTFWYSIPTLMASKCDFVNSILLLLLPSCTLHSLNILTLLKQIPTFFIFPWVIEEIERSQHQHMIWFEYFHLHFSILYLLIYRYQHVISSNISHALQIRRLIIFVERTTIDGSIWKFESSYNFIISQAVFCSKKLWCVLIMNLIYVHSITTHKILIAQRRGYPLKGKNSLTALRVVSTILGANKHNQHRHITLIWSGLSMLTKLINTFKKYPIWNTT